MKHTYDKKFINWEKLLEEILAYFLKSYPIHVWPQGTWSLDLTNGTPLKKLTNQSYILCAKYQLRFKID
jgi:hypothetical protein